MPIPSSFPQTLHRGVVLARLVLAAQDAVAQIVELPNPREFDATLSQLMGELSQTSHQFQGVSRHIGPNDWVYILRFLAHPPRFKETDLESQTFQQVQKDLRYSVTESDRELFQILRDYPATS